MLTSTKKTILITTTTTITTLILLYRYLTPSLPPENEDQSKNPSPPRNITHLPTSEAVIETSSLMTFIYTKFLTLPQPIWRPLTFTSITNMISITFRAFILSLQYTFTGTFAFKYHLPIFLRLILSPLNRTSLLTKPTLRYTSGIETLHATPTVSTRRNIHQINIQRGQGLFIHHAHNLHCYMTTIAKPGWDSHLTQEEYKEEDEEEDDENDTFDDALLNTTTTKGRSRRHMRKASGLTWKCELCGERSAMNHDACMICGTKRPEIVPQKGDLEEATPTQDQQKEELIRQNRMNQRVQRRKRKLQMDNVNSSSPSKPMEASKISTSTSNETNESKEHNVASLPLSSSSLSSVDVNEYAVVELLLLCPKEVTSMDVGRLYGSIMTIFAAVEQFGLLKNCVVTPNYNQDESRNEILGNLKFNNVEI